MRKSIIFCLVAGVVFLSLRLINSTRGVNYEGDVFKPVEDIGERAAGEGETDDRKDDAPGKVMDAFGRYRVALNRNDTLYDLLCNEGIAPEKIVGLLHCFTNHIEPRHIHRGDSLYWSIDNAGNIEYLQYLDDERIYTFTLQDGRYECREEENPYEVDVRHVSGVIDRSLYETVIDIGERCELAVELASIFEWKVDFFTDLRRGDFFHAVIEYYVRNGRFLRYGRIRAAAINVNGEWEKAYYYRMKGDVVADYFNEKGESQRGMFLRSPLNYRRISSYFSYRRFHPILKRYQPHLGIDYAAPIGTPVVSIADGRITFAGRKGPNGNLIILSHRNNYITTYGHLSNFAKGIKKGKVVKQGQIVGYVGSTGRSTGPHLDFRMKRDGKFINPLKIKPVSTKQIPRGEIADFMKVVEEYDSFFEGSLQKEANSEFWEGSIRRVGTR